MYDIVIAIVIIGFFGAWTILTIGNQVDSTWYWRNILANDIFRLLPRWTFFSPHPGIYDYFLLVRWSPNGSDNWTDWRSTQNYTGRKWYHPLVNPEKRLYKIYIDIAASFARDSNRSNDYIGVMHLQVPYFALGAFAQNTHKSLNDMYFQFSVVRTHGIGSDRDKQVLLVSKVHKRESP